MANPLLTHVVSEKLSRSNHALWKAQVLAVVRGARLEGYLTGTAKVPASTIKGKIEDNTEADVTNPLYEDWAAIDQQVLGYLLTNVTKDVLLLISSCKTAAEAWAVIEANFSSVTKAHSINTRIALATTRKGSLSIAEYVTKMRALGEELASSGKRIEDDELLSYIFTGLNEDFNPVVTSLVTRIEPMSVGEAYAQLLSYVQRQLLIGNGHESHLANMVNRGRGVPRGRGNYRGAPSNRGGGAGRTNRGRGTSAALLPRPQGGDNRARCQLCKKKGNTVIECWHKFDENFVPDERYAGAAANSYGVDTNYWRYESCHGRAREADGSGQVQRK